MKFDYTNTGARERKTFPRARTHIQQSKNGMLAKRRVRFVLSIQVIPAQLGLHKDLFFYFYTIGPFYNGVFYTKTLIVTKIKYVDVAFLGKWLITALS